MLSNALRRRSCAAHVFRSLADVYARLLARSLVAIAPVRQSSSLVLGTKTYFGPGLSTKGLAIPPVPLLGQCF